MAATMQVLRAFRSTLICMPKPYYITGCCRTLLSEAYKCNDAWKARLQSPILHKFPLGEFAMKLYDKSLAEGQISLIDISIVANKMHEMRAEEEEIVETLLKRFRYSQDCFPTKDSVNHAVIRSYIESNRTSRLLQLMKNRIDFGIFPDNCGACLLLDHLIKLEDYSSASQVAYELMLQEDFSHELSRLLSLYAIIKHLTRTFSREYLPVQEDDGEEEYVVLKVVNQPFYDDHFDIKDERFLMGKTLFLLGRTVKEGMISRSMQLIGLALYDKYSQALDLLEKWTDAAGDEPVVNEEAVEKMSQCLEEAPTRDPDAPEKDFGLLTIDDEINMLKLTPAEKEMCQERYKNVLSRLQSSKGKVSTDSLDSYVNDLVPKEVPKYEADDIKTMLIQYQEWQKEWSVLLEEQIVAYQKKEKEIEVVNKLKELQEKEELLTFYENRHKMKGHVFKGDKRQKKDTTKSVEEEFVEAPGQRTQKKMKKK